MGIFKESLKKGIQDQLAARTNVVKGNNSNFNRNPNLPFYLSKNSWVRMSSMVNYTSGDIDFDRTGKITTKPNDYWVDDQLSQRYILEGGTLYTKNNGNDIESALRKNIAVEDGAYGGDFDVMGNGQADEQYTRQFGIRPMPGITGVNLHTVGAYGSIFETTIKFYAWDAKQLSDLELLFMRPGYSVLLEWGWSQYITNSGNTEVWPGLSLNPFQSQTQQEIYNKLQAFREKYNYNYDGMLGYVKNFNWNLMPNGGFDCSTTLISMGEVINSLKISTNNIQKTNEPNFDLDKESKPIYDDWEKILISLKASAEKTATSGSLVTIDNEENYYGKWNHDEDYIERDTIQTELKKYNFDSASARLNTQPFVKSIKTGNDEKPEGNYYEYLSLDVVMAMMDSYFNFNVGKNSSSTDKIVKIIPPGAEDYCLAGRDSISVDPSVCIVGNRHAFQEEFKLGLNPTDKIGVVIPIKYTESVPGRTKIGRTKKFYVKSEDFFYTGDFYNDELKVGLIGNIYVNISLLLDTYKQQKNTANDDGVNFTSYMKSILNKISNSLGGLNNFILSTAGRDQNTLRIVDTYYLEKDGDKKYELDIMGLGSICRETNIRSEIFPEQATMVAIAAQSRANLGDIYNSTQAYLNAGLEDRVALAKEQPNETKNQTDIGNKNNPFYQKLLNFLLYVRDYVVGDPDDKFAIETQNNGNIPTTFLKQFMLKYNGELNFKALIPFKLTIKLDGIGGIVIGEIFKIKQNILPKNYYDKNLGFIITNISHDLQDNDWETTLETQICILDNISLGKDYLDIQRQGFEDFIGVGIKNSLIFPILVNFIEYLARRAFIITIYTYTEKNRNVGENIISPVSRILNGTNQLNYSKTTNILTSRIEENLNPKSINQTIDPNQYFSNAKEVNYYESLNFIDYVQQWVNQTPVSKKSEQIIPNETYGQVLNKFITEGTEEYDFLQTISSKIPNNIDMFYNKGKSVWNGVLNSSFNEDKGYKLLRDNIISELINRDIINNNLKITYQQLEIENGDKILEFSPIENNQSRKISIPFDLNELSSGAIGVKDYQFTPQNENLLKSWLRTFFSPISNSEQEIDELFEKIRFQNYQ